jgi:hypothetical protein
MGSASEEGTLLSLPNILVERLKALDLRRSLKVIDSQIGVG